MSLKTLQDAQFKATAPANGQRVLDFYASSFSDTVDSQGDTVDPHAYDAWLTDFYTLGKPLPISFSHAAMLDGTDPFDIIGFAPADREHVFADDYGLRVRGPIDMSNPTAEQVAKLVDAGVVQGASLALIVAPGGEKKQSDGSRRIMQASVREAGPCLNPADLNAYVVGLKDEGAAAALAELLVKHSTAPRALQAAHDALVKAGAKCAEAIPVKTEEELAAEQTAAEQAAAAEAEALKVSDEADAADLQFRLSLLESELGL